MPAHRVVRASVAPQVPPRLPGDDDGVMDPTRRLIFWLKVPYAADVALVLISVALLLADRSVGWWVLVFAVVRAIVGTIALVWVAPRMLARRSAASAAAPPPAAPAAPDPPAAPLPAAPPAGQDPSSGGGRP
ncbi:hypothetical protein [Subtercola sp. YIM 133946]|uniref:hypothetical protein n=1 Tax=Subtercola sp. YIM 133946 TaxID=3118909 RepID=UPI002F92141B